MRRRSPGLIWLGSLLCLLAAPAAWAQGTDDTAAIRTSLLQSAQRWSDQGRIDVARQMVAKLLAIEPGAPEGLALKIDLALREGKTEEAGELLRKLQAEHAQHLITRQAQRVYAVYTRQRDALARMRLLARAGRRNEAAELARQLFPEGVPSYGALAREIARLTGQRTPPAAPAPADRVAVRPSTAAGTAVAAGPKTREARRSAQAPARPATPAPTPAPAPAEDAGSIRQPQPAASRSDAPQDTQTPVPATATAPAQDLRAQADALRQAARLGPALQLLEQAVLDAPDDAWLRYDLARLYLQLQRPEEARKVFDQGLQRQPQDSDMRFAHALLLAAMDEDAAALAELQHIAQPSYSSGMRDLAQRLRTRLVMRQAALLPPAQGLVLLHQALQEMPRDPDLLLGAARLERSLGHYSQALALFQQAHDGTTDASARARIEEELQGIAARRQAWVEMGQLNLEKNTTEGLSSLRGWERPVVAWVPWGYEGRLFAHLDAVHLDAGSYRGSDPFAQPGSEAITAGLPQNADGINWGVGYQGDAWRWDLGSTGQGFAVPNWVGGLRYDGTHASVDYSLELSRRPLTGTLLSYAGTTDPITGQAWGGVVASGASLRLGRELGPYSLSASASYAQLSGRNVADNTRLGWRLALSRDAYADASQRLTIGLTLAGLEHARDLSGYTWGHGGYYSPVHQQSVTLPLEWSGRKGELSWLLRASVSASSSSSTASDYYPGNAAMQQATGKVYAAGSSVGTGWAASAAAEYQVDRRLSVGAEVARVVSDYYTPLNLNLYARYWFEPAQQPRSLQPRPVQAYSQF